MDTTSIRHDWTVKEARAIYELPLTELIHRAQTVHRAHHPADAVQLCTLLSIKTGACPEDCAYCPQSSKYETEVQAEKLLSVDEVLASARKARDAGASRFCMGAAWRGPKSGSEQFERVLQMVRGVRELGLEACATLGMLTDEQARKLKEAGLTAYNHNIDTSKEFYGQIITTRQFEERLETLRAVSDAGIRICSGGIIGMGEAIGDRIAMLVTLANLDPHPESVPINALVAVAGTPLEGRDPVHPIEMARMCATARILMPKAMVRLSAGRTEMSEEAQLLCIVAGANSIFYGEKLLTTGNPEVEADLEMMRRAGLRALVPADAEAGREAPETRELPSAAQAR
ncbi:MAG: biotin synthase BioB [Myxococcales bacterium]|nr:biotin synthase BioB [Myxococcales bacterium]